MATVAAKTNMDMLNGPLGSKILRFAIPIALSSIFQQMFNLADTSGQTSSSPIPSEKKVTVP